MVSKKFLDPYHIDHPKFIPLPEVLVHMRNVSRSPNDLLDNGSVIDAILSSFAPLLYRHSQLKVETFSAVDGKSRIPEI
jgi:hypothetical protein